jgi:hypothetical protein
MPCHAFVSQPWPLPCPAAQTLTPLISNTLGFPDSKLATTAKSRMVGRPCVAHSNQSVFSWAEQSRLPTESNLRQAEPRFPSQSKGSDAAAAAAAHHALEFTMRSCSRPGPQKLDSYSQPWVSKCSSARIAERAKPCRIPSCLLHQLIYSCNFCLDSKKNYPPLSFQLTPSPPTSTPQSTPCPARPSMASNA